LKSFLVWHRKVALFSSVASYLIVTLRQAECPAWLFEAFPDLTQ
jgi:hypothetical protein